jgi:hypothetical protein
MKKFIYILLAFSICLMPIITFAQWSTAGNTIIGAEYLGGDNSSTVPLRLKTVSDLLCCQDFRPDSDKP